jgi:hypothetical protein
VLPGAELAVGPAREPGEAEWRVKGLPQHGFPYAIAVAALRPDAAHPELKVRALRVDPRTVVPAGSNGTTEDTPTIVSFVAPRAATGETLRAWFASGVFLIDAHAPSADATALADGVALASPAASTARAAVGVQDEDGMLDWVELAPEVAADATSAHALDAMLARAGCTSRMLVTGDSRALLGGTLDLAAQPFVAVVGSTAARLVRGKAPGAHLAFESTPVVAPEVWQKLQSQRVRYFRRPPKKASATTTPTTPAANAALNAALSAAVGGSATALAPPPPPPGAPPGGGLVLPLEPPAAPTAVPPTKPPSPSPTTRPTPVPSSPR